mgnify:CR=1 FL=1
MVLRNVATNFTFEQQRQEINLLADDVNTIDGEVTTLQSNVTSLQSLQGTETSDSPTFNNLTLTGYIAGPASMTIDPAAVGDNTGTLVIAGNLQVNGVTTTVNSENLTITDKNIIVASNATDNGTANGAGLTVAGSNAALTYNGTTDEWELNRSLRLSSHIFCQNVEPSNNIQLLDNKKLLCGAANDLQIFHDSSNNHSRIKNTAGQLWLQSDNGIRFTDADINQSMAAFYDNGAVELYYNGTKKFETHSNGVMTSGRLFINSTNAGFDYNTIADTFEILTTNGSVHSEFNSGSFYPATGNSKDLGINIKRWKNVYVSNAIYLNDRIIWGSYPSSQEPTGVNEGDQYYNTTDSKMKIYDGSNWVDFGSGGSSGGGGSQNYATLVQGAYGSSNISGLSWSGSTPNDAGGVSSIPIPTNRKTYIEILWSGDGGGNPGPGVCAGQNAELGLAGPKGWWRGGGHNGMETSTWTFSALSGTTSFSTGQYLGIGMDPDANSGNGKITFYRNGTAVFEGGSGWTGRSDLYFHWQNNGNGTSSGTFNFGATAFQYPLTGYVGLYS